MSSLAVQSGSDDAAIARTCVAHGISASEFRELQLRAAAAKATAHAPYSRFRVGACLLAASASVSYHAGANVENASSPVGICAERVAMAHAVTTGARRFRAVAVATDITPPASPCGMCRQFMREFCGIDVPIFMFDKNQDFAVMTMGQLLPAAFGPDDLSSQADAAAP